MLGSFQYYNPTKIYFGEDALRGLDQELPLYGSRVMFVYGGGSIKRSGVFDEVIGYLTKNGKEVFEFPGIMSNPTVKKLREGVAFAREHKIDMILAAGGGSCCDFAKAVAISVHCEEDPWDYYFLRLEKATCEIVPVGCVLTMAGTGSEMNGGSVLLDEETKLKLDLNTDIRNAPRFSILNPRFTFTVPYAQMVAGAYDAFSHICEQYFSGTDDNTSDYISEGLMRSIIHSSRIAAKELQDYEARSNLMWCATWALNTLVNRAKTTDWMVHMISQSVAGYTNAIHGMSLAPVSLPYYRRIMADGLDKFRRFAITVWDVRPDGKTDMQIAEEGLRAMEAWMLELGLTMHLRELGVTDDMLDGIVKGTRMRSGGYKVLTSDDVREILQEAM